MRPAIFTTRNGAMVRADALRVIGAYHQAVIWLRRITPDLPGAVRTACWDATRSQILATSDGTFGVGLSWTDPRTQRTYDGYVPTPATLAIADTYTIERITEEGLITYQAPIVVAQVALTKGDVLVLGSRRLVVGDEVSDPLQAFAVTAWRISELEERAAGDIAFQIATT